MPPFFDGSLEVALVLQAPKVSLMSGGPTQLFEIVWLPGPDSNQRPTG
jgi:hypothetical protein